MSPCKALSADSLQNMVIIANSKIATLAVVVPYWIYGHLRDDSFFNLISFSTGPWKTTANIRQPSLSSPSLSSLKRRTAILEKRATNVDPAVSCHVNNHAVCGTHVTRRPLDRLMYGLTGVGVSLSSPMPNTKHRSTPRILLLLLIPSMRPSVDIMLSDPDTSSKVRLLSETNTADPTFQSPQAHPYGAKKDGGVEHLKLEKETRKVQVGGGSRGEVGEETKQQPSKKERKLMKN